MAFGDDIALKNVAGVALTFARQTQEANRCTWIDTTTTAMEPRILRISHRREPIKALPGKFLDRHTVEINQTKKDSVTGELYTQTNLFSCTVPLLGPVTRADINDVIAMFAKYASPDSFLNTTASIDRLLRGEL